MDIGLEDGDVEKLQEMVEENGFEGSEPEYEELDEYSCLSVYHGKGEYGAPRFKIEIEDITVEMKDRMHLNAGARSFLLDYLRNGNDFYSAYRENYSANGGKIQKLEPVLEDSISPELANDLARLADRLKPEM